MVLVSLRTWVDPRVIVVSEGLSQRKIPINPSWIEPATFRLLAQYLNQRRTPQRALNLISRMYKKRCSSAAIFAGRALLLLYSNKFQFYVIFAAVLSASSWRKWTAVLSCQSHSFLLFYLVCPQPKCTQGKESTGSNLNFCWTRLIMTASSCFAIHLNYRTSKKYQPIQTFNLLQNVYLRPHIVPSIFLCRLCNLYFVFFVGYTVHDYRETSFKRSFHTRVHRKRIPTTTSND